MQNLKPMSEAEDGKPDFQNFTVDAALLRELGERLVGRSHVALAELVKNSYDADAQDVIISFKNDSITVSDNGSGMSKDEFIKLWLRVGTTHKQELITSPGGRIVTGSKGVGRLAVQFLGDKIELISKKENHPPFKAVVNWITARESGDLVRAGAEIYSSGTNEIDFGTHDHGTSVTITGLKQTWDPKSLQELARELWFLQPPKGLMNSLTPRDRFNVAIDGPSDEYSKEFSKTTESAFKNWIAIIEGELENGKSGGTNKVKLTFKDGDEFYEEYPTHSKLLDKAKFKIYVFKLSGKQAAGITVQDARDYFKKFGGIHIYDNAFRLPYYGGEEQDWLGLEIDHSHRLNKSKLLPSYLQVQSGLNDLPTNGRIFGVVEISTSHERNTATPDELSKGEYLNVQVTRDRLIDNEAFSELEKSVRWAIDFYAMRSYERRQFEKKYEIQEIPKPTEKIESISQKIFKISLEAPSSLSSKFEEVSSSIEQLKALEQKRENILIEERILLASLATTGMAAIAMEHELHKELTILRDIRNQIRQKDRTGENADLLNSLDSWAERTTRARKLFSPLMNEYDREKRNQYNAKKVIDRIIRNSEIILRGVTIEVDESTSIALPNASFAAWNAIFQNIFTNAVNAMINSDKKLIRCTATQKGQHAYVLIEDTGAGVDLSDSENLFKPFVRRLEIPEERKSLGLGGMGMGLTIVKMVADSLGCDAYFEEPSPNFNTAFKLSWNLS
ncbi:TPA: ATP-binding protein [Pseudomonas aeruginosa]|uniref:ATP-binding protein n=1 Tax=Pseudomonas aeruginosa TaxID=287 RepID=UPI0009F41951|nr:ATP-binding protein [Pseudomonas aeruginosa]TEF79370.1 sensor histidine kinase [Pseudomonas aeruginosa]TEG01557.1 sensor histidine kinase [Pseudomonas aeruginosa]TEG05021.1 sensor histidine kinase [Pseudomonas aeruginosa]HBO5569871.1 sensor histidine kinase [Pseudomonas aeruginosa]HBO6166389.1 sensor histidine kinase [Pseudomonas aeruginosa]